MHEGAPFMTITLMGGDMQAQGHAQTLVDVIDLGANVQAATDMARFRHEQIPDVLTLESSLYDLVGSALTKMGHEVRSVDGANMGGFQSIMVQPQPRSESPSNRSTCIGEDRTIARTAPPSAGKHPPAHNPRRCNAFRAEVRLRQGSSTTGPEPRPHPRQ